MELKISYLGGKMKKKCIRYVPQWAEDIRYSAKKIMNLLKHWPQVKMNFNGIELIIDNRTKKYTDIIKKYHDSIKKKPKNPAKELKNGLHNPC